MSRCTFEFAEGDGGPPPGAADAGPVLAGSSGAEDLPLPSTLSRADLRNVLPGDTMFSLADEAAGGGGAQVFASSGADSGVAWGIYLLAAFGLYYATRQN